MDWFREEFNTYEYCYYPLVHVKKLGYKVCQVPTTRIYPKNEVPSKIKGLSSNFKLLKEILNLAYSKTRPDQTRPIINNNYIYYNNLKYNKLQHIINQNKSYLSLYFIKNTLELNTINI